MTPLSEGLKPCPFCGSGDIDLRESITDACVACNNCGCRTGVVSLGPDEASAAYRKREVASVWNTRTEPSTITEEGLVEQVARAMQSYHDRVNASYAVGDVPSSHWNDLARAALEASGHTALLSQIGVLREALTNARPYLAGLAKQGEDNIWRPAERHLAAFDAALSRPLP